MNTVALILDTNQAQFWAILLPLIFAGVVSVINAIKSKSNGAKLDVIHQLTNSNLTAVKSDLVVALKDIAFLKKFISENPAMPDPDAPKPEFIAKIELAPPAEVPPSPIPTSPFPPPPKP